MKQQTRDEKYYKRLEYEKMILSKFDLIIPPEDAIVGDLMQVYRLVEDAHNIHSDDFIPKAYKQPYNPRHEYTAGECGISVFSNLEAVEKILLAYRGRQTQIAIGNIYSNWGKHSGFNEKSHANFWKYSTIDYEELVNEFRAV